MSEWRDTTLDQVVELKRGMDLPSHARRDGHVPVLSAGSVAGWHDTVGVRGPGMVIGRATNLGRPTWSDSDFWPLNTTLYAANFKGNEPKWVYHLFESMDFTGFDSGSVQPMLNRNYIAKVRVKVPPLGVQRAIADVLSALDDKIAANTKLATAADELALTLASRFVPSVALGDVAQQSKDAVNPAVLDDEFVLHYSLPAYDAGQEPDVVSPATIKSNKFLVTTPGVLVSKLNPRFPRVWNLARLKSVPSLASTEYVVLRSDYCSSSLLWSFVAQPGFGAQLEGMVAGTSGSHQRVKPSEILAVEVPDPRGISVDDGREVEALALQAIAARAESRRLAAARDALLPALMSGRLTVRDAEAAVVSAVGGDAVEPEAPTNGTLW